jgi:hypothetical protein
LDFAVDTKYAERKLEAKKRGYKWGGYHYGKPGDPIKQADFFLETAKPEADDLIALDLESTDNSKHMSFAEAREFIKRIKEKTGRYPVVYANNLVTKAIAGSIRRRRCVCEDASLVRAIQEGRDGLSGGHLEDLYTLAVFLRDELQARGSN